MPPAKKNNAAQISKAPKAGPSTYREETPESDIDDDDSSPQPTGKGRKGHKRSRSGM